MDKETFKKACIQGDLEALDDFYNSVVNEFPNGLNDWQETHFEIVSEITKQDYDNHDSKIIRDHYDSWGTGGIYDLAKELTDKFELENKDKEWGIDYNNQYFDVLHEFLKRELYEL